MICEEKVVLIYQSPLGIVAQDGDEPLQIAIRITQRSRDTGTPETMAVFTYSPAVFFGPPLLTGLFELAFGLILCVILGGKEYRQMFSDNFRLAEAKYAFGTRIPADDEALLI